MSSQFVSRLLEQVRGNQEAQLQALDEAIASAGNDSTLTNEEKLKASQLIFALRTIAAIASGSAPWPGGGPTDQDKDWAIEYFKANRAGKSRPPHFDGEIEELLQHVAI